jgi:hypothetical protein
LDSLAINDGTVFTLEALDMSPGEELEEWIKGADSDGALLARPPKSANRAITATIRVEPQSTMNLALAKIALIVDKLQEAKQNDNGLALTWVPADSTLATVTFRCLSGQITGLPIDITSGWFVKAPLITVRMTCLPFAEGAEVTGSTTTTTDPIATVEITSVAGDVPALGRLVVTDNATQARRFVSWGLESRWYPTSSPPSLILDSTSLVTTGFAGTTSTQTGAYSGATNNVIAGAIGTQIQAICGLGNLAHVGQFRVMARCFVGAWTNAGPYVRLTYQTNDDQLRSLPFVQVTRQGGGATSGWNMIDLGLVTIPQAIAGTQRWTGRIEAVSDEEGPTGVAVDVLLFMPAERFGRARATYAYTAGVTVARDAFTSITATTVLNARVAPLGGTWATSGATTDFVAVDGPAVGAETETRATISDSGSGRHAVLGATSYTNIEVGVDVWRPTFTGTLATFVQGPQARWVDASNRLTALVTGDGLFGIVKYIAGAASYVGAPLLVSGLTVSGSWYRIRLIAFASGRAFATLMDTDNNLIAAVTGYDTTIATGGTLATGKPGFIDLNGTANASTRYFDNFYAATPAAEPIALNSAQSIEFRHNATLREDSTGTYYGNPPEYVGSRFLVPPAGGPARKARVAVIARRNDVMTTEDDNIADSLTIQPFWTPRYAAVPRA